MCREHREDDIRGHPRPQSRHAILCCLNNRAHVSNIPLLHQAARSEIERPHYRIVELNVAIITSCMAAMPRFFSQSRIFKAATYRRFRTRFFGDSTKTGSSGAAVLPQNANGSKSFLHGNNNVPRADYSELQELPRAHTVAGPGEIFHGENDSGLEIATTTTFDVISGANTERYHTERYGKP